ncbi:MAG: fatty acid desaturase [Verrucomicrobiota bacterium]|nr:fatty acid desaturase [Verrucomicrobiota bacterium]
MNPAARFPASSYSNNLLRHGRWDALPIALALGHGVVLVLAPYTWVIALGVWWNSNTIAHNFIHLPFFRARPANRVFSAYLSVVLGIPQALWRQRHLAHHANVTWRLRLTPQLCVEALMIAIFWSTLCLLAPRFFFTTYLPGCLLGLGLCWLHGYYEHARGTTSHYGRIYNALFFNDGYHIEHHANPAVHWRNLPRGKRMDPGSRWPAALRWLENLTLDSLERLVLRSPRLQRFVLRKHERAFRRLLPALPEVRTVGIVGGAIFPRTALILKQLLPEARLTVIDAAAENIRQADLFLPAGVQLEHALFDVTRRCEFDLIVIPLSFIGDRGALYRRPPAAAVLIHDWLWCTWPLGAPVSVALLKRLNLVQRDEPRMRKGESAELV